MPKLYLCRINLKNSKLCPLQIVSFGSFCGNENEMSNKRKRDKNRATGIRKTE